ncbi:MAG: radical SAM protein [Myxococcota bacterium]
MQTAFDPRALYRLPWNLSDNGISWLEPTSQCNLACDGCYRENRVVHKSLEETKRELDVFARHRKSDALSIAGGDPLLYPHLAETVREAKRRGYKPVVNTNGHAITKDLLRELKQAGLAGITFHVDSRQGRPGKWRGKDEIQLCALRAELAELAHQAGIGCAFNATIYPDTLDMVVPLARWAEDHMDRVSVMVFILYRDVVTSGFQYFSGDRPIPVQEPSARPVYNLDVDRAFTQKVTADAVVQRLQAAFPGFAPSAYLNGTEDPTSVKWLLTSRIGRPGQTFGYAGPKFQELVQSVHHAVTDRYLAYSPPSVTSSGKLTLGLAPFDAGLRGTLSSFMRDAVRSPLRALREPLHFQSILIIQPIDLLPDGRMNMCDGCPDMTVHGDELVWSCRMDERIRYGRNLWARPIPTEKQTSRNSYQPAGFESQDIVSLPTSRTGDSR